MFIEMIHENGEIEFAQVLAAADSGDASEVIGRIVPAGAKWAEISEEKYKQGPPLPFAEALRKARDVLKEKRRSVENGGFIFQGLRWDSEVKDELRLNSIITRMMADQSMVIDGWKVADGNYISLDLSTAMGAADAMLAHYYGAFALEAAKLAELEKLGSHEELREWMASKLDAGW